MNLAEHIPPAALFRLPPMSAALVMMMLELETRRGIFGMNHCREREVGAMRRTLGPAPVDPPLIDDEYEIARDQARTLLAQMCATCPHQHCKMVGWGVTGPAS